MKLSRRSMFGLFSGAAIAAIIPTMKTEHKEDMPLGEITAQQRQLLYLQLYRAQVPIDSRTVAEALDIPNYGNKPDGNTVHDRWIQYSKTKGKW